MQSPHAAKFLRSNFGVCLVYYDTRRGQVEGQEGDKVLAFYPPGVPTATQSSIVGLSQALTMFAGTFNKDCPFHIMDAENTLWCMYHCEPDVWLLMIVSRQACAPTLRAKSLQCYARTLHSLTTLLFGPLSRQLQQDASAQLSRRQLNPLLQDAAAQLLRPELKELNTLSSPLGMQQGVPLLPVSDAAFTRMQSLVNQLLVSQLYGSRLVAGALVAYQQCLLWSSLKQVDTLALFNLAARTIIPAVKAGPKHRTLRPAVSVAPAATAGMDSPAAAAAGHGSSSGSGRLACSLLHCGGWGLLPDGWVTPVAGCSSSSITSICTGGTTPSQGSTPIPSLPVSSSAAHDATTPPNDAAAADGGGRDAVLRLPQVWLEGSSEHCLLLPWHCGTLVVVLLVQNVPAAANVGTPAGLLQVLRAAAPPLLRQLSAELPAQHIWHVKGLRYLVYDAFAAATRASPASKVATLSLPSLALAAAAQDAADLEAAAQEDPTAAGALGDPAGSATAASPGPAVAAGSSMLTDCSSGAVAGEVLESREWGEWAAGVALGDVEVAVKGANEAWAVARHAAPGRELCVVVEGDREVRGLAGVLGKVGAFCNAYCPWAFEGMSV